jgi:hypothetical protein
VVVQGNGRRCAGKTLSGWPCRAQVLPGKRHCLFHDPARRGLQAQARWQGARARNRGTATLPADVADLARKAKGKK